MTTFRLAIDRLGREGADFVTIRTWERLAEASAQHLTRGRRVAVQGRLAHEEWVGSDGRRAKRLIVVAGRVDFLYAPANRASVAGDDLASQAATGSSRRSGRSAHPERGGPNKAA